MLHVPDERLIRLIALGKKRRHTFPANYRIDTRKVCHPKVSIGVMHKVYIRAPFGNHGDPDAEPLLAVLVTDIRLDVLADLDEEDARGEGFASLDAYAKWWNAVYANKAKTFRADPHSPVWIISFELRDVLPAGKTMIERLERRSRSNKKKSLRRASWN